MDARRTPKTTKKPSNERVKFVAFENFVKSIDFDVEIGCYFMEKTRKNLIDKIINFLGVSSDVANFYCQVLCSGATICSNPDELRIAKKLEQFNLIAGYLNRKNQQYYFAVDPNFSFPAIVLHEMWQRDSELHTFQDLMDSKGNEDLKIRLSLCTLIERETSALFDKSLPFLEEDVIVVEGKNQVSSYISSLFNNTANRIRAVVSPPHLLGEVVWQTVLHKMTEGLKYERVSEFSELCRHGFKIYTKEVTEYSEDIFIFREATLPHKFYIINDTIVLFFKEQRAQIIKNKGITGRYVSNFNNYKSNSIELKSLLPLLTQLRNDLIKLARGFLADDELEWYKHVFDYGCFLVKDKFSSTIAESALEKCLRNNLVIVDGDLIYAKYTMEDTLKYAKHG